MEKQKTYKFLYLKIIVYSLLLMLFIVLGFMVFSEFSLNQFINSYSGIGIHRLLHMEFIPFFYVLVLITDLILILYRKLWAFYIFYLWMIILLFILLIQSEIDQVNVILLLFLLVVFGISHLKMYQIGLNSSDLEENLE